ncbi:LacI family repressor for deo operon, udp, cdd, tsx, nupC, and nupG [Geomicrobium halophilum]|uniref:LacI family repressor for deo operon, udp, cdd, tsx, nupC, and nupG n=1 Tax=Geomicrobium halophilum TaxID=549000 RepID=A0A841PPY7_9BACL|nr:LacI family repressor for deo operon, udp, cdd, tsx, nupC, and nupG [Geomicrobium halophilum]
MTTLKDVANLANVSIATVSRVFSESSAVTSETRKKVINAAEILDYHPNALGRQLRNLETKTILIVVPDITNTFFSNVIRSIESIASDNGFQVFLADTKNRPENEERVIDHLRNKQVDGVILLTARTNVASLNKLSEDYPVVLACEYMEHSNIPSVSIDNISSARKVSNHFFQLGHKKVAHISGPMEVVLSRDRLRGYKQSVLENRQEINSLFIQEGDFSYESGYQLMEKLLALESPPSAVFAANDEMAIGAINAIKHYKLRVPEDISVAGFDDIKMSRIFAPPLTTISQPALEIGEKAMKLLLDIMGGEEVTKRHIVLNDQLIIRDSCKRF